MDAVVSFKNVSKLYLLGSRRAYISYLLPDALRDRVDKRHRAEASTEATSNNILWALRDVSFEVPSGEMLGLIGANGAGKTTALSLLAGIISPSDGEITVRGRVGALIKLGAGFHPDLTGRENVYLNGSILGLKKTEIDELYDTIVDFSELHEFMDTPVKRYSSGMYVRLGFSVAVHTDPDLLLVDEILSVGDVSFQARCLNRIGEIREQGKTIIFVSHNMHHVASFCDRVIYLHRGQVRATGEPGEVLGMYTSDLMRKDASRNEVEDGSDMEMVNGSGRMRIINVTFHNAAGEVVEQVETGEPVTVRVHYEAEEGIKNPLLDVVMRDATRGNMFQATNRDFGIELGKVAPRGHIDVHFQNIPSNNQVLSFFFTLWNSTQTERFDWKRFIKLQVTGMPTSSGRFLFNCDWQNISTDEVTFQT